MLASAVCPCSGIQRHWARPAVNNLVLHSNSYPVYEFNQFNADEFDDLFSPENAEWCRDETKQKILEAIRRFQG